MTALPCKCGCGAPAPTENRGGFASQACYLRWAAQQRPVPDDARITALRERGMSIEDIAKTVHVAKRVVSGRLRALGVTQPQKASGAPKRSHQKNDATPTKHYFTSRPYHRSGSYQHPPLGEWLLLRHPSWCEDCRSAQTLVAA